MVFVKGEALRLFSTRLPWWSLGIAALCSGGLSGLMAIIGPENAQPPLPSLETPEGVGIVLGLNTLLLFVPALIGTIAITGEYRHNTIAATFLVAPRRGRVLGAKLATFGVLGLAYGLVAATAAGTALLAGAALRGQQLGAGAGELLTALAQLALASAEYMLLGVAIGALARSQLIAVGAVLGYFYFLEYLLLIVPGINAIYAFLPGGATASLTQFTFLAEAVSNQTALNAAPLLPPSGGALVLLGYTCAASLVAVLFPLQRDLT